MHLFPEAGTLKNPKRYWYAFIWLAASIFFDLVVLKTSFAANEGAGYSPESIIPMRANESYDELAKRMLPANTRLLFDPIAIDFGADKQGLLMIIQTDKPTRQYRIWYLAPQIRKSVYHKIVVRDSEQSDPFFDLRVHDVFGFGPEGARDLVLLEEYTRSAAAGGESHRVGSVYRRSHLDAVFLKQASASLDNARSENEARKRLKPWYANIPTPNNESLVAYFLEAPVAYIHATKLERWQLIQEGSPRILVRDLSNSYVHIAGDGGSPGYILALLRTHDKSYLFALQTQYLVGSHTVFLKRVGDQWKDVSSKVLPEYKSDADYKIPHMGTDLTLTDPDNKIIQIFKWNRQRFVHSK